MHSSCEQMVAIGGAGPTAAHDRCAYQASANSVRLEITQRDETPSHVMK
jgi:hypothetical protein